jgi:UDP-2,4-diacetamido-2,4,6-trideoxy-beta-L-altropyranose hydrolase
MKVAFRVDASLQIGTGHVMRCLTLAEVLREVGARCHFVCREHPGNLIELILQRGFTVNALPATSRTHVDDEQMVEGQSNYATWLGADWTTDAAQSKVGVGETAVDWLIVDHYALDARWELTLRPVCKRLMVIDDLADRPHDCDLLLDQNLGRCRDDYVHLVPARCQILLGPNYALLRPEFAVLRDESLRRRAVPQLNHLLISIGGVDQADATGKILEALKDCQLPANLRVTVVMGPFAPWLDNVKAIAKQLAQATTVVVNTKNIAKLMTESDLAIGAAGSTSWERCCLGLPTLLVVVAENQRNSASALEKLGCIKQFSLDVSSSRLNAIIREVGEPEALAKLSQKSCLVTDGHGATRVMDTMSATYA